jgi:hypothetical protein
MLCRSLANPETGCGDPVLTVTAVNTCCWPVTTVAGGGVGGAGGLEGVGAGAGVGVGVVTTVSVWAAGVLVGVWATVAVLTWILVEVWDGAGLPEAIGIRAAALGMSSWPIVIPVSGSEIGSEPFWSHCWI